MKGRDRRRKQTRRHRREPIPVVPALLFVVTVLYNLVFVRTRPGAEFLYTLLWPVSVFFAVYAIVSFFELKLIDGAVKSVCHFIRRAAQWGMAVGAVFFIVVQCFIMTGVKSTAAPGADCIIIMGAGLEDGYHPAEALRNRLDTAVSYLSGSYSGKTVIVTGGQGGDEHVTEAYAMKEYLVGKGVPADIILTEEKAKDSKQSLDNTRDMIPAAASVAVVSSEFHLYRCSILAKRSGINNCWTIAAPTPNILPRVSNQIREFFSVVLMWLGL